MILKSKPIVIKMISLSKEEHDSVIKQYNDGGPNIKLRNQQFSRTTLISIGSYSPNDDSLKEYRRMLCGSPVRDIVVSPYGSLISLSKRQYWWDYNNDSPMYGNTPATVRKSMLSAFQRLKTKYALFLEPKLTKV